MNQLANCNGVSFVIIVRNFVCETWQKPFSEFSCINGNVLSVLIKLTAKYQFHVCNLHLVE